jgi:nitrate reductase alpha subunit
MAQAEIKDWSKGECSAIPGQTMPHLSVVERDYADLYNRFISFGSLAREKGIGVHGLKWDIKDFYDELLDSHPVNEWNGQCYPSLSEARDAADLILLLGPETNGELAYRAFKEEEKKVGVPLADLAENERSIRRTFADLLQQPARLITSPCWSGIINEGRSYTPFALNIERLVPWRTLTGRQEIYLDHELYQAFGESLPTYKINPGLRDYGDLTKTQKEGKSIVLKYLTPHGKWHIHSTYYDNQLMLTLSRGIEPLWLSEADARKIDVKDNDWVEIYNDHGVAVTRAVVSSRIPDGACMWYHSPERTISLPKSPLRGLRRAGGTNSLTAMKLNPVLMAGGYAQFTYGFNYWGPTGVNRDTQVLIRKLPGEPVW